jgi:hypothetical protein
MGRVTKWLKEEGAWWGGGGEGSRALIYASISNSHDFRSATSWAFSKEGFRLSAPYFIKSNRKARDPHSKETPSAA